MKYYYRVRHQKRGGHIHCRAFSTTTPNGTWAKIGELVLAEAEWLDFQRTFNAEFIEE